MLALRGSLYRDAWDFSGTRRNRINFGDALRSIPQPSRVHKANLRVVLSSRQDGAKVYRTVGVMRPPRRRARTTSLQRRVRKTRTDGTYAGTPLRLDPRSLGTAISNPAYRGASRNAAIADLQRRFRLLAAALEEEYNEEDWSVERVEIGIFRQGQTMGGAWAPLPKGLEGRYSVLNLKVERQCFAYCVAAHLHPPKHNRGRVSCYTRHLLDCPDSVALRDIPRLERQHGIQVNVYGVTPGRGGYTAYLVYPYNATACRRDPATTIPLILHDGHYSLVTNFGKFAGADRGEVCRACLMPLKEPWADHAARCAHFPPMRMLRAPTDTVGYSPASPPHHVLVADFESMLPPDGAHVPCAWAVQPLGGELRQGFGEGCVAGFLDELLSHASPLTVVYFHNLRNYDSHLILKHLADHKTRWRVEILPMSSEKVIGFTLRRGSEVFRFVDSVSLLPGSLQSQLENAGLDSKLPYPYEYFDSWARYEETELPPIEAFYSTLSEKGATPEEYEIAQGLMSRCADLKAYTMEYVRGDVVGLGKLVERFRGLMRRTYGLDPCAYWSAPGMAWAALLKETKVQLEMLPPEMYLWLEGGIRGGISVVSKHAARGNVTYFDANNLYGWAMSQPLPVDRYEWVDEWVPREGVGHILEVDLDYPDSLHFDPAHQQYPLAVETVECEDGPKLCGTFEPKRHYVLHERALRYYVEKGLVLAKVHRVLRFRERAWMKPYIDKNSALRAKAASDFESDFYKLMNNSVYGKTLESPRNRSTVKAFTDDRAFEKYVAKPTFVSATRLGPHLVLGQSMRTTMVCNKIPAVGVSVLDLSKLHMARWHYDVVMPRVPGAEMCATDTDSFFYHTPGHDAERVYALLADSLDTSNFPPDHPLHSNARKKVPGYFKSEVPPPDTISEGVWLRAKMYSLKTTGGDTKKVKGVSRRYVKSHLTHEDFRECFDTREDHVTKPHQRIMSYGHQVVTESFTKVGLSCHDNKRQQLGDTYTLPFGACDAAVREFRQRYASTAAANSGISASAAPTSPPPTSARSM